MDKQNQRKQRRNYSRFEKKKHVEETAKSVMSCDPLPKSDGRTIRGEEGIATTTSGDKRNFKRYWVTVEVVTDLEASQLLRTERLVVRRNDPTARNSVCALIARPQDGMPRGNIVCVTVQTEEQRNEAAKWKLNPLPDEKKASTSPSPKPMKKAVHNKQGNCYAIPKDKDNELVDVCLKHDEVRGDCSECPRCTACDAEGAYDHDE